MCERKGSGILIGFLGVFAVIVMVGPDWWRFPMTVAITNAVSALGVVFLMRVGYVTFGQSLFVAWGAYTVMLVQPWLPLNDLFVYITIAALVGGVLGLAIGAFLGRFNGIFFAMITLAFTMVLYGLLANTSSLGGTDGRGVSNVTFFGYEPSLKAYGVTLFVAMVSITGVISVIIQRLYQGRLGWLTEAVGQSSIRVSYLGVNPTKVKLVAFVVAAVLGSVGGAMRAISVQHVSPDLAYWTTAGELVLIAILGKSRYVVVTLIAAILISSVEVWASVYFPYLWEGAIGIVLLIIILILPDGIDGELDKRKGLRRYEVE